MTVPMDNTQPENDITKIPLEELLEDLVNSAADFGMLHLAKVINIFDCPMKDMPIDLTARMTGNHEWKSLARTWSRPAAMITIHKSGAEG